MDPIAAAPVGADPESASVKSVGTVADSMTLPEKDCPTYKNDGKAHESATFGTTDMTVVGGTKMLYRPLRDATVAYTLMLRSTPGVFPTMVTDAYPCCRDMVTDGVTNEMPLGGFAKVTVTISVVVSGVAVRRIKTVAGPPTVMLAGAAAIATALNWLTAERTPLPERM